MSNSVLKCISLFLFVAISHFLRTASHSTSFTPRDWNHEVSWMGSFEDSPLCLLPNYEGWSEYVESAKNEIKSKRTSFQINSIKLLNSENQKINYRNWMYDQSRGSNQFRYLQGSLGTLLDLSFEVELESNDIQIEHKDEDHHIQSEPIREEHRITFFESLNGRHNVKHVFWTLTNQTENKDLRMMANEDLIPGDHHSTVFAQARTTSASVDDANNRDPLDVKILSYNIWNYNEPWNPRLEMIVKQIKDLSPDVIGFQEVRFQYEKNSHHSNAKSKHQIEDLASNLKEYQYVFQPAMTYLNIQGARISHVDEGLAIMSKWPIIETSYIKLSRNFSDGVDEHQRICLRALIKTPKGEIDFFVIHMSLSDRARMRNMMEIYDFARSQTYLKSNNKDPINPSVPQIIVGDYNAEPNANDIQFLLGNKEFNGIKGNFKDAWIEKHGKNKDEKGWTYITLNEKPKKRIDFVLYRGAKDRWNLEEVEVLEGPTSKAKDGSTIHPSDHRPLYAKFRYS